MGFELKQGDVFELENGEHWLYGDNVSFRLENTIPSHWRHAEFDDNMKTKYSHEQVVKIWRYDKFIKLPSLEKLDSMTPSWVYEEKFKVNDIIKITYVGNGEDTEIYFVNKDGHLINRLGHKFCGDTFPTYDRIKNSPIVDKVELMKLTTVKEL